LRPLQRAGNRRYYRPADVALAQRIHRLLNQEGYTIRGVQQLLSGGGEVEQSPISAPTPSPASADKSAFSADDLRAIRNLLAEALQA
jgi:DNA-binding transcriptional MerR regulator